MKRNYLVILVVSILLIIAAFLVFPRKTSDPVTPSVDTSTEVKSVDPKPVSNVEPNPVLPPVKEEPTVVASGPQAGDPPLPIHIPAEAWKTARKVGDDIYLKLPPNSPVIIPKGFWTATFQNYSDPEPMWKSHGLRQKSPIYSISVYKTEERARRGVRGFVAYFTDAPKGTDRISPKAVPGEFVFTSPPSDWLFSESIRPENKVVFEGKEEFNFSLILLDVPDEAKQIKDPYLYAKKLFEAWGAK